MKIFFIILLVFSGIYASSIEGDKAFAQKDYIKAIKNYKKVSIKDDPNINIKLSQCYVRLGDNFTKIRNYKKALSFYKKAQKLNSRVAKIKIAKMYESQGDLFYRNKKYKKAQLYYLKSYRLKNKKVAKKLNNVTIFLRHQRQLAKNDTRLVVNENSPIWTKSIGRLIIPTKITYITKKRYNVKQKKCSATLVNLQGYKKSRVIVTASHCLEKFDKKAGDIRFIIRDKKNEIQTRLAYIINDSKFSKKKIKTNSDYAILVLNRAISSKDIKPLLVEDKSFVDLKNDYEISFGSLGGFSKDIGDYGLSLTYDPKCKLKPHSKTYAFSTCSGYKGASGGPVIINLSNDNKSFIYRFVGVVSHFKKGKFKNIYFAPHHIFYESLKNAIYTYNR